MYLMDTWISKFESIKNLLESMPDNQSKNNALSTEIFQNPDKVVLVNTCFLLEVHYSVF